MKKQEVVNTVFKELFETGKLSPSTDNLLKTHPNAWLCLEMRDLANSVCNPKGSVPFAEEMLKYATENHLATTPLYKVIADYNDKQRRNKKRQVFVNNSKQVAA